MVSVWIKDVDRGAGRISLTMVEPPDVDIRSLKPDTVLTGTVVRLENFGAFVDIGAGRDGMIHVTEMARGYVGSPSDIVSVGDVVQVRVLDVDPRRGRISLSMKDLPGDDYQWIEEEEAEVPTAMELALQISGRRSTIVYFGLPGDKDVVRVPVLDSILWDKTIRFSWLAPGTWQTALQALGSGLVNVEPLVTHQFPLADLVDALAKTRDRVGNPLKPVVIP